MENFIEKLKSVDKKVWIGVGIGAAVIIILIIALVIGLGNKPTGGNDGTESKGGFWSEMFGTEKDSEIATEVFGTEEETEVGTEIGTEVESTEVTESESENVTQGVGGTTVTKQEAVNGVEQQPITTKPNGEEIFGLGTESNPYYETPDIDTMTLTTVSIPAGDKLYYNIYRVGGMYLTISDADAYVITSDGVRHDASNGVVSFKVESALSSDAVAFQIGNKSGTSKAFTLKFANLTGSQMNPEAISGNGPFTKHLDAGNDEGYYYQLNAAQGGSIRIYMTATANTEMNVQNNSSAGTVARSFTADVKTDEQGREYIELPVSAGDAIRIHVQAIKPTRGAIPATDITFEIAYY